MEWYDSLSAYFTICQIALFAWSGLFHYLPDLVYFISLFARSGLFHCLPDLADSELHVDNEIDTDLEYNSYKENVFFVRWSYSTLWRAMATKCYTCQPELLAKYELAFTILYHACINQPLGTKVEFPE